VSRIEDIARHCEPFFGEAISGFRHKIAYHFMAHVVGKNILLAMTEIYFLNWTLPDNKRAFEKSKALLCFRYCYLLTYQLLIDLTQICSKAVCDRLFTLWFIFLWRVAGSHMVLFRVDPARALKCVRSVTNLLITNWSLLYAVSPTRVSKSFQQLFLVIQF
jgi:hypothetical protein